MDLLTGVNDHGRRLDRVLRKALPDCPLPLIHRLLRQGLIHVDGKPAGAQTRVFKGSKIHIPRLNTKKIEKKSLIKPPNPNPDLRTAAPACAGRPLCKDNKVITQSPKAIKDTLKVRFYHPPEILWQNQNTGLIAFNKPAGLAVHGPVSLDRMAKAYFVNKLPPSLSFKPGPLHRLDKPSSGIVVFSTSLEGAKLFTSLMKDCKIKKTYIAIVEGIVEEKYCWTDFLTRDKNKKKTFVLNADDIEKKGGKIAVTMVTPLKTAKIKGKPYTLIEAQIETGRTHQIRAQSAYHGFPLAGDRKYGGHPFDHSGCLPAHNGGFFLHAWKMEFETGGIYHKIEAPLPEEFKKLTVTVFA